MAGEPRIRLQPWVAITLLVLLSACGPGLQDPAEIPPPNIMANGVAGSVISYCRSGTYCADGGINPTGDNPMTQLPVTLTFEEPIGYITAHVSALGSDDVPVSLIGANANGATSGETIRIEEWPDGEWQYLIVFAGFAEEVSVSAYWEIEAPDRN